MNNETPPQPAEEVVLNRRGIPARQRKKNKLYYDEDVMITSEVFRKPLKKIKQEPMDAYDEAIEGHEDVDASLDGSLEIVKRGKGRPPGSGKKVSQEKVVAPVRKQQKNSEQNRDDRISSSPVKEKPGSASRLGSKAYEQLTNVPRVGKAPDLTRKLDSTPVARGGGPGRKKSTEPSTSGNATPRSNAAVTPVRIKREPGEIILPQRNEKRIEARDKFEREKERERMRRNSEKNKQQQRREKDMNTNANVYITAAERRARQRRSSSPMASYAIGIVGSDEPQKSTIDKKIAQDISLRLRNLLKLPKAHKWVCYEWFYSNIDKTLFEGENDFQICLKESFPQLKARRLTRVEWCKIRRLMGKPRRCSNAFFEEEREELARRRQKIRMIQQRKVTDFNYKELPDEIPLQLVIGTKVTARLRRPQDGLFTGTIDGVDTSNNTYRITFDRSGLGTHSIPDYEVLSNDQPETVSTSSFALKIPRRSLGFSTAYKNSPFIHHDDGLYTGFPKSPFPVDGMLGGFPIRLLDMIVRLSKLLKAKREKILHLKELNVEAEKMRSYSKPFNEEYRLRYARCILDLDSMNKEMGAYLEVIQQYCLEIAPDHGVNQMIVPEHVQETSKQEAHLIVDTYNSKQNRTLVSSPKNLSLIASLTSLMLQIKALSSGDRNLYELKSIKDTMREIKASLEGKNVQWFQDRIEIPMNRIQAGLI